MNVWKTPNGKEIGLRIAPNTSMVEIQFNSGGQLPKELAGMFTSQAEAARKVEAYLEKKAK